MTDYSTRPTHINGKQAPYEIRDVSLGMFSVARYYGGCKAFGTDYVYDPTADTLIRQDCLKIYNAAKQQAPDHQ